MTQKRITWTSTDGKYRLLATYTKGDHKPNVRYWRLAVNGRKKYVRYKDLPKKVKRQIEVLRVEVVADQ